MNTEQLQSELEQSFTLQELLNLTERQLGVSPGNVGGVVALGSYVRALTRYFSDRGTLSALADAVIRAKPDASAALKRAAHVGFDEPLLELGERVGDWNVAEHLGRGPCGQCYVVFSERGGPRMRLKVYNSAARNDIAGMARFLAFKRAVFTDDPELPSGPGIGVHEGAPYTIEPLFEGQSLAQHLQRTGPLSFEEALDVLRPALVNLCAMHDRGLVHGNIKPENVLVAVSEHRRQLAALLDSGLHLVRYRRGLEASLDVLAVASPQTVAPEVLAGLPVTPTSDVYAVGVLLFEMLTGSAPFVGSSAMALGVAHMTQQPALPSELALSRTVAREVDDFVLGLLSKHPQDRPATARRLLDIMEALRLRKSQRPPPPQEELGALADVLKADPASRDAALALETMVDAGADARDVASTFLDAATRLSADEQREAKLDLNFRAARLLRALGDKEEAESVYVDILELDAGNRVAGAALEDLRRELGKHNELVELWLNQLDAATSAAERASLMANIGRLYEKDLDEPAQALVAYCQAVCTAPRTPEYVAAIERVAGQDPARWNEVLQTCSELLQDVQELDVRSDILVLLGQWYHSRAHRLDLAVKCYQRVKAEAPSHTDAVDGLIHIYRRAQQWTELAQLLTERAETLPPPGNRELLVEAAVVFANPLGDTARARELLEGVLELDPLHGSATDAIKDIYIASGDAAAYARLLERQIANSGGGESTSARNRLAQLYYETLADPERACELYESVLRDSPDDIEALRGLERIYERAGRFKELLATLQRHLECAATPRQTVHVLSRLAQLHEQEFLDPDSAASCLESVLSLDPRNAAAYDALERLRRNEQNWSELAVLYEKHASVVPSTEQKAALLVERAKVLRSALESSGQAIETFEQVLQLQPDNAEALAGLADLRQASGDAEEALKAMDQLARNAPTNEARAEHFLRAAQLLRTRKELAAAVERYQLALEAVPTHTVASNELRSTYIELGDPERAINLLYELVEPMPVGTERAKLTAELARLLYEHTSDWEVAAETAAQALEWNDTAVDALFVLAEVFFDTERFEEACEQYARLMPHVSALPRKDAIACLLHYIEALSSLGAEDEVSVPLNVLKELAPDDLSVQRRLAESAFERGDARQAEAIYEELLTRFDGQLSKKDRAGVLLHYAECVRRNGRIDVAISMLEDASELDPMAAEAWEALARIHEHRGAHREVWEAKQQLLALLEGDARVDTLIELGELASQKLNDSEKAASCFVRALDERPNDRKTLTRLMQLYTEEKEWVRLVDVVLRLADFVTDEKQKAKYLLTAGMVTARELSDTSAALQHFERVLALDPSVDKAFTESLSILDKGKAHERVEELLTTRMKSASTRKDGAVLKDTLLRLGALYKNHLNRVEDAIEAFEAAHTLDSSDQNVWQALSELYGTDSRLYFEKARKLYTKLLVEDPYRAEAYKALRKIYTDTKNADGAWCLCQALSVLKLAQPDEERFYKRMRSDDPAYAQAVLTAADYERLVVHQDVDAVLTTVFAVIEPAVITSRAFEFQDLGYDPNYAVDLAQHPYPVGQTLHYAAGVLGMDAPPAFDNTNDPGGLAFLDTKVPAISMGLGVLNAEIHPQALAFLAGRHLTYYRPGLFLRQLIGTGTGLKAWLFAAIKLISPGFPIAAELQGPVDDNSSVLRALVSVHDRDELARAVSRLLQNAHSLDLHTWVNAIDHTADRVGFVLAHDLETAVEVVRSTEEDEALVRERVKQLVLYSISPQYLELRRHLRIDLGT